MDKKVKIVFLMSGSYIGGAEKLLLDLVMRFDRDRFQLWVISLFGPGMLIDRCKQNNVSSRHLNLHSFGEVSKLNSLKDHLQTIQPDIIQTCGLRADIVGRLLKQSCKARALVSWIHSPDPWRKWYHVLIDRLTAMYTDLFISVSEVGLKSRIERERFSPEKIIKIPNGIDVSNFEKLPDKTCSRKFFGLKEQDSPVIGVLANLRKLKGHYEIINTLPLLNERLPNIRFIFAGKDASNGDVARYAEEKGVKDRIVFAGFVESRQFFSASDIFLLASYWEGCPISVLEAMAAGIPIIATNVGGIPEIIENKKTAILIPPYSSSAIKDALISLVEDKCRCDSMVVRAREIVRKRFEISMTVEKYQNLYLDMFKRSQ
jgi:glycosyltransferase involved in cell wall biosynthesis